jgi:centrosomal protein CEP104
MLEMQKDKAVREENFDEAKKIKDSIDKLKKLGLQIAKLEERKNLAIEKEDFDTAKIIKAEIDRIKHNVAPESMNWRDSKGGSPLLGGGSQGESQ